MTRFIAYSKLEGWTEIDKMQLVPAECHLVGPIDKPQEGDIVSARFCGHGWEQATGILTAVPMILSHRGYGFFKLVDLVTETQGFK